MAYFYLVPNGAGNRAYLVMGHGLSGVGTAQGMTYPHAFIFLLAMIWPMVGFVSGQPPPQVPFSHSLLLFAHPLPKSVAEPPGLGKRFSEAQYVTSI